jgi:predicted nucleic acid-binding protein
MLPLRLVIDTNVLVSAAIRPAGLQRTVLLIAISKPARLYFSHPILEEYSEVLARPELRIRKGLRLQLLQLIENYGPYFRLLLPSVGALIGTYLLLLGLSSFSNGPWDCCPHQE